MQNFQINDIEIEVEDGMTIEILGKNKIRVKGTYQPPKKKDPWEVPVSKLPFFPKDYGEPGKWPVKPPHRITC